MAGLGPQSGLALCIAVNLAPAHCRLQVPSRLVLAADYLLSTGAGLAAAAAAAYIALAPAGALPGSAQAAAAGLALWVAAAPWLRGRPTAGRLFGEPCQREMPITLCGLQATLPLFLPLQTCGTRSLALVTPRRPGAAWPPACWSS